jgi:hypothetical protein
LTNCAIGDVRSVERDVADCAKKSWFSTIDEANEMLAIFEGMTLRARFAGRSNLKIVQELWNCHSLFWPRSQFGDQWASRDVM